MGAYLHYVSTDEISNYNETIAQPPLMQALPKLLPSPTSYETPTTTDNINTKAANLQKLCKVWGFVKYTHLAFLSGAKDWDEELLELIPMVLTAAEDEINDILYSWFISLGDDGYEGHSSTYYVVQSKELSNMSNQDHQQWNTFINSLDELYENYWLTLVSSVRAESNIIYTFRVDNEKLQSFLNMAEGQCWIHSVEPISVQQLSTKRMSNTAWTDDRTYLGMQLSAALARFREIRIMNNSKAPVHFSDTGVCDFSNEKEYYNVTGVELRLLGLFRLWNAIEYYYPYKDIMDHDWNELLLEQILELIEGADAESYTISLYTLSAKINDGHIYHSNEESVLSRRFGGNGRFAIPAILEYTEGKIVILKTLSENNLQRGDVVLCIDGTDITDIIEEIKRFIAVPNDEKLKRVLPYLPLCKSISPEVTLLRNNEKLAVTVEAIRWSYAKFAVDPFNSPNVKSHELLADNIGLINPGRLDANQVQAVMSDFISTSGLIIDLRQYPGSSTRALLAEYLLDAVKPYAIFSKPFIPVPGLFFDTTVAYAGPGSLRSREANSSYNKYYYDKPVVILMNQRSQSACESMIMCLRLGPNVTVIGSNSIGANGNITYLSLPGASTMSYTCFGTYASDGSQTQRIGLTPDIYVESTIEGIRDGRDELMEAAIAFLLREKVN